MIIKEPDPKDGSIKTLQSLASRPDVPPAKRLLIEQELRNIRAGIRGESEAAYEMQVRMGASRNWAVIHDLRIEHEGLVAQIDHLIISRMMEIWVCESKHFSEGVAINERGEFTAFYNAKPYGIPSPIEQNERHILALQRIVKSGAVVVPTRLGVPITPTLKSLILVSQRARIARPARGSIDTDAVIKSDQLWSTIEKSVATDSPLTLLRVVGSETLESFARSLCALHKPQSVDWHARFGLAVDSERVTGRDVGIHAPVPEPMPDSGAGAPNVGSSAKLICHHCSARVPYNVARFCWFNKSRFGGHVYCMACQSTVPPAGTSPTHSS